MDNEKEGMVLSEDQLEKVSGGSLPNNPKVSCGNCGHSEWVVTLSVENNRWHFKCDNCQFEWYGYPGAW